jgi:predicted Zn-dependent protease
MRCSRQLALPILVSTALAGCAGTTPGGCAQFTAPSAVSSLYSSIDMNLHLASASPVAVPCSVSQCRLDRAFDRQVERTGNRLARTAYELDPQLQEHVPSFSFVVAENSDAGSASDASGSIVVFRGVRENGLDETALAYVMAREMGRVMARHHDEKSATTILTTILAQLLVPALSLTGGIVFLAT